VIGSAACNRLRRKEACHSCDWLSCNRLRRKESCHSCGRDRSEQRKKESCHSCGGDRCAVAEKKKGTQHQFIG